MYTVRKISIQNQNLFRLSNYVNSLENINSKSEFNYRLRILVSLNYVIIKYQFLLKLPTSKNLSQLLHI